MTLKIKRSFQKSFLKVFLVVITLFALGLGGLYSWFIRNSNGLLIDLVNQKSGGKLKLELSHVTFDFFSNEVKIHKARISGTGKANSKINYQVSFQKVTITTNSLWSAVVNGSLEVRKIKLYDPVIEIFNWQKDDAPATKHNLSLGRELGKLYHSVNEAIIALNTHSISLVNAKIILNNNAQPGKKPLLFSNIYFTIKKLNQRRNRAGKYSENSDVIFSSSNQDITFTDGIHKLLFKKLSIQGAKDIILDSCTIITLPTQASRNSYNISFKRLALRGVDFDRLYKTNLIKADSVYCENPFFNINLTAHFTDSNSARKQLPDIGKIMKEFAGNLDLGFVGVMNSDIRLNITGNKTPSNIHSGKVNFQLKNLRIDPDSLKPVSMSSFDMLIKSYQLYNADSTCIYSFDSVRFGNDNILLHNFSVHTSSGNNKIRNFRNYSVPYFELRGLAWPELIFKQTVKASTAILHNPIIDYRRIAKVDLSKKFIISSTRRSFDDFMNIGKLQIINGRININWGSGNSLQLQGFHLDVSGGNLLNYKKVKFQKNIESLFFSNGFLKVGDISARLQNVNFKTNNQLQAEHLSINSALRGIEAKIDDVSIRNIYARENGRRFVVDGLQWEHGDILIHSILRAKSSKKLASIWLSDFSGKQTGLKFVAGGFKSNAFVEDLRFASLKKNKNEPVLLQGLKLKGKEMAFFNSSLQVNVTNFTWSDNLQEFSGLRFKNSNNARALTITASYLRLTNDINTFFCGNLHVKSALLESPVIEVTQRPFPSTNAAGNSAMPVLKIDHIVIHEPIVNVFIHQTPFAKSLSVPYSKGSEIKIDDINITAERTKIGAVDIKTQKSEIEVKEKVFKIDNGVAIKLSAIDIPAPRSGRLWKMMITNLAIKNTEEFRFNIKRDTLVLRDISIGDCLLSSASINDPDELLNVNPTAWASTSAAKYTTKNSLWQCFNVLYNAGNNSIQLDSFNYRPVMTRDAFISANPYEADYIDFNAGRTNFFGFCLDKYFKEDSINIQKINLSYPSVNIYRDKSLPFLTGMRKKLFTENIRAIDKPVSICQINIDNGTVSYTEKNEKTRLEATLLLTRMKSNIFNLRNYGLRNSDSLSLAFSGYLLNTSFFDLKINQSYVDSLYGFIMTLTIAPTALAFLNPILAPLSNVKFTSGNIDKFALKAVANENVAYGELKFNYHNLRIKLLQNGGNEKTNFTRRVASTLINTFILRRHNRNRSGIIYFKRLKDRSFFNYLIKIINSGISTSVGAKKNSRVRKNLAKENIPKSEAIN